MSAIRTIRPEEARQAVEQDNGASLLDVRTPAEHGAVHAAGARNLPLDTLDPDCCRKLCVDTKDGKIYLLCKSGTRARMAAEKLLDAGHEQVYVVEGGTDAWERAGLPVVRGRKTISLENQVRIAAGSIAATGALLALLVHPGFAGISLFVGCGLVFAGLTDTCMMGMLLMKMPWNRG